MGRKRNESPEKQRRRAIIAEYLKEYPINDPNEINELAKELIAQVIENSLDGELDDHLGYPKHDYSNNETENSRNGYSKKSVRSSFGDLMLEIPRDRNSEFEPQIVKNIKQI